MIEIGKNYYFIKHAYYHYVGRVTEILGVRRVALDNVVQVHSSKKSWTEFFKSGFGVKGTTKYDIIGSSPDFEFLGCFDWPHEIPKE